jgi:hypothetical protein
MSDTDDCGCCSGTAIDTPAAKFNRPGLPAIGYRVGTQQDFKATLLARLSSTDYPALAALGTRSESDYTIALLDAAATMADVLTFYQERIANEAYLRTATERRSVLELARLIGYRLAPGVAATTALAFTLQAAPGQPSQAPQPVTIPAGTRVQSVPDPGQNAQNFETVADIAARVEWNAIPAQQSEPVRIWARRKELHLAGTGTQLQAGDAILFVGAENDQSLQSNRFEVRWLDRVDVDATRNTTRIAWLPALADWWSNDITHGVRVHALRQRAALFGNNAPDPRLIFNTNNPDSNGLTKTNGTMQWANFTISTPLVDLDATYPKIVAGSWMVLIGGGRELYRVTAVSQHSRADFGLSAKITSVQLDHDDKLTTFDLRETLVLAQSEELTPAGHQLSYPLYGGVIALDRIEAALLPGQVIAVSGKRQRVAVGLDVSGVSFPADPKRKPVAGESFLLVGAPAQVTGGGLQVLSADRLAPDASPTLEGTLLWRLEDSTGNQVWLLALAGRVQLQPAAKDDPSVSEICTIASGDTAVASDGERTTLTLQQPLAYCYDRSTVAVNANVAPATHGETVGEIAGNGDASQPNQSFRLKQAPLTYVATAADPSGRAATLHVRVNDLEWSEAPTLYGRGPREHVYTLRQDDNGNTDAQFGDGVEGARLPSGQNNVRVSYRKGIGSGGNLRSGQLTTLLTRPLGVQGVTNPAPSSGGQDAETLSDARKNAPLRVLTLDRAVSVEDYANFARTFAGIAKAFAVWIGDGRARGIHLTVAGPNGAAVAADTAATLLAALRRYGDALLPLSIASYAAQTFRLGAKVKPAPDADGGKVLATVEAALRTAYSFDARDFGQPVTIDEVYAVIQDVAGVVAADIRLLYRSDTGAQPPQPSARLLAALPAVEADGSVSAAELLTLHPAPLELGVMT